MDSNSEMQRLVPYWVSGVRQDQDEQQSLDEIQIIWHMIYS
jgi:hypothetical protein